MKKIVYLLPIPFLSLVIFAFVLGNVASVAVAFTPKETRRAVGDVTRTAVILNTRTPAASATPKNTRTPVPTSQSVTRTPVPTLVPRGLRVSDGTTIVYGVKEIDVIGAVVTDSGNGVADLSISGGGGSGPAVYRALLTQTGTNAPVAVVLENSLGGTVVWTRDTDGSYSATLAGAFPSGKTFCLISSFVGGTTRYTACHVASSNYVEVYTFLDFSGENQDDDVLSDTPIEILVY